MYYEEWQSMGKGFMTPVWVRRDGPFIMWFSRPFVRAYVGVV